MGRSSEGRASSRRSGEIEEESGCVVEAERLVSVDSRVTPPEMLVHVFACRHLDGEPAAREAAVPDAGWFGPAEARRLVTQSPAAERLRDALELSGGIRWRAYSMRPYEVIAEGVLSGVDARPRARTRVGRRSG